MEANSLRRSLHLLLAFALVVSQLMLLSGSTALAAPIVTVNSTGDTGDLTTGDGLCSTGAVNSESDPECTLRAAIEEANASSVDEIHFDIPTSDPGYSGAIYVIEPLTVLPWITQAVSLDATTEPGFAGTPIVVLDGSTAPTSPGGTDGLLLDTDGATIRGLVVRDFEDDGIEVHGDDNTIVGNHVLNNDTGVLLENASDNVVGGSASSERNVISDNANNGVVVDGSNRSIIRGNYIGVEATGATSLANVGHGVQVGGGSLDVMVGPGNVISGNTAAGVRVDDAGATTTIIGNHIGVDAVGSSAVANGTHGVSVGAAAGITDIGGAGAGEGNVISGNTLHGIDLEWGAAVVTITANRIGTNVSGGTAVGNGEDGVRADSDSVVIVDNQVSGNGVDGLRIERLDAVVQGNLIGTDAAGTGALANGDDGIDTGSGTAGTMVGGTGAGEGNVIAFNTDDGIVLRTFSGTTAAIVSNSVFGNGGLGIDLADDGPTPNDAGDTDPGPPNDLLNFPVITSAETAGSTAYLEFELDAPAGWHRVEFFANPSGTDPTGYGEGETLVTSTEVFHDGSGALTFSHTYTGAPGEDLTATTTYCPANGCPTFLETSEFSEPESLVVGNNEPSIDPVANQTTDEGVVTSFTATADDPDVGDSLTFSLTGAPAGSAIDPTSGVFTWTPSETQGPGTYTFDVVVTDDGSPANLSDSDSVTITVGEVNVTPDLVDPGDQTVDELSNLTFAVSATDADVPSNTLTYGLVGAPSGAVVDPDTGVFSWTPAETQGPGTYTFDLTVSDDGSPTLGDTETISITVNEVNTAPSVTSPGDQANSETDTVSLAITATDPDIPANGLTFTASGLPPGLSIDPSTGVITGTIQYNGSDGSPYTTTITVTDDGSPNLADQTTFTWTVANTNRPPVLGPVGDRTVDEQTTLGFTTTASDPDGGDVHTFSLVGAPTGAVVDPNTGVFSWTPTEAQGPGAYIFDVVVTDNGTPSLDDTETVTVTVNEVNRAPVLTSIANATIDEETNHSFTAGATDPDNPANDLTYSLSGAPAGASINPTTGRFSWVPTEAQGPGTYTFSVIVTDNGTPELSDTEKVTISVLEVNGPPVAIDDSAITLEDVSVTVSVLGNDTDPNADPLIVSSVSDPAHGTAVITADNEVEYTPTTNFHGVDQFTYEVSDGLVFDTGLVTVTIGSVNDDPVARDDKFTLVDYRPATLDVLHNDFDPDGDMLSITLRSAPAIGSVSIEGGQFVYQPLNGWTGSVTFSYLARDSLGAVSEASVELIVGDEVLIGARNEALDLGAGRLSFEAPEPGLSDGVSLIDIDGISLLTDSFVQTVGALRIPLGFLGLTVAMVIGLGTASEVPALILGSRRRHWAVVRLGRSQRLPAYSEPGGRKVVYNYDPTAEGVISLGKTKVVGNTEWLPVDTPNGKGWIYRKYLTEQVDLQAFAEDTRPTGLVNELASRLRRGKSIGSLVSPEGLIIALTGSPTQIAPDRLKNLLQGGRLRNLPNNGKAPNTSDEFNLAVTEPLLEAYSSTPEITARRAHSSAALIPTECWNFPYLALGSSDKGQPWLVFFEYRNGRAYIAGIGIDE